MAAKKKAKKVMKVVQQPTTKWYKVSVTQWVKAECEADALLSVDSFDDAVGERLDELNRDREGSVRPYCEVEEDAAAAFLDS